MLSSNVLKYVPKNTRILNQYSMARPFTTSQMKQDGSPKSFWDKIVSTFVKHPRQGRINSIKPIRLVLKPNKTYLWCACGYSSNQPFCSGAHVNIFKNKALMIPKFFKVKEEKEYSLCTCKRTKRPPYCDGTHKNADIQQEFNQAMGKV